MDKSVAEIKLRDAERHLQLALEAHERVLNAQSWRTQNGMDNRSVENVSLASLQRDITYWQAQVNKYTKIINGGNCGAFRIGPKL